MGEYLRISFWGELADELPFECTIEILGARQGARGRTVGEVYAESWKN